MVIAQNPILKGFFPDPSICRVGDDFYLVNSTFAYVPGVPVFHSKDLANWEQIGNVLERESQLPLDGATISRGIFAPSISWNNGIFYMITTNISHGMNFYVTATNPAGPWSEPTFLTVPEGIDPGIDPSLFFEDGKCYYVGQRQKPNARFYGDCEVWIQELDLEKGALVGEGKALYAGSMQDACWVEGPHVYHIGEYYYITCAEMGTAFEHSISVARSKELMGPYENYKCNPLLTHRHLGRQYPIQNIGHGELVSTPEGKWYLVMLGTRPIDGTTELGRETFLAEVTWEEGWPVVNPGEGRIREEQPVELPESPLASNACPAWEERTEVKFHDTLDKRIMFYRHPQPDLYHITSETEVSLKLAATLPEDVDGALSYMGLRQQSREFAVSVQVNKDTLPEGEAGLLYMHDDMNYLRIMLSRKADKLSVAVTKTQEGVHSVIAQADLSDNMLLCEQSPLVSLKITGANQKVSFFAGSELLAQGISVAFLSSEISGGFVGCTYGIHAFGQNGGYADFKNLVIDLCCDK